MAIYNASAAAGNIIGEFTHTLYCATTDSQTGPLLFNAKDAPYYIPGIRGVLGIFSAQLACVGIQVVVLFLLNRVRRRQRVAAGKPEYIRDTSMMAQYEAYGGEGDGLGQNGKFMSPASIGLGLTTTALDDLTDYQNNEFVYIY
jgi:hypothetical protein